MRGERYFFSRIFLCPKEASYSTILICRNSVDIDGSVLNPILSHVSLAQSESKTKVGQAFGSIDVGTVQILNWCGICGDLPLHG